LTSTKSTQVEGADIVMKSTIGTGHTIKSNVIYPMAEATNSESFEEVVEWAYGTLPQEIRDLPDFPGIRVADEPPEDVLKRKKWPPGREMLGLYSGIYRTERLHNHIRTAPDLIFVFRGPISRCSIGLEAAKNGPTTATPGHS
jgi:predicted Zn-dependent protease with MMP-like domain